MGKQEKEQAPVHMLLNARADAAKYTHFLKLDPEKQSRILEASYDEFLSKGYGEASTNEIVRKAGISKGLLFRYFGSKEGLYQYLMEESTRRIAGEALGALPTESGDVFEIIKSLIQLKITVCQRYPKETNFLIAAWTANLPDNLLRLRERVADMSNYYYDTVLGLLDEDLLHNTVEKSLAVEIIVWVCEKYTDKVLSSGAIDKKAESWNRTAEDLDKYMDILRRGLYKE